MQPLNKGLYSALVSQFRHVEIGNRGETAHVSYSPIWEPRKVRLRAEVFGGEYYRINCPYCSDTRQRLWISYRWAEVDPRTRSELLHLAICFNEDCIDSYEVRQDLFERVYPWPYRRRTEPKPNEPVLDAVPPPKPRKFRLPADCIPIDGSDVASQ